MDEGCADQDGVMGTSLVDVTEVGVVWGVMCVCVCWKGRIDVVVVGDGRVF